MAQKFIEKCVTILGSNPFLWIAFQSNVICDYSITSEEFNHQFQNMLINLESEMKFYSPSLKYNMRNSHDVAQLAKSLKSQMINVKMTNVIETLATHLSSLTSNKPNLIPISQYDFNTNLDDLIKTATEEGTIAVILYSNKCHFDPIALKNSLMNISGVEKDDIFCHSFESNNTKVDMKKALLNPKTILICQDELFTGMEANAVVYCVSDGYYGNVNLRVNVMRATSKLNIIYQYAKDDDNGNYINFGTTCLNPKFMTGCDEKMKFDAYECLTCKNNSTCDADNENNKVIVCKSCLVACHNGHQIETRDVENELKKESVKCECKSKCYNCLFFK
jgi:hypothetical protein